MKFFAKSVLNRTTCLQSAVVAAALIGVAGPTAAFAQSAPAGPSADEPEQVIVVTGSRISRPNIESAIPIASIGGEEFFQQGQNSVGDTLNDLPQLRSTFAQQNPGAGVGIAGLNLLDLRGLGTVRTLVLVNGRRHVPADILNNAASVDVNTIPNDLIERVDIVTGGNSAVYGSDAIAGVVNFVLKRNFDGIQVRANAGVAEEGFGANYYASAMVGKNFADGRGNITVHGEYARSNRVYASDVPWFESADGFVTYDVDSTGLTSASDGFADARFARDIRSGTIHRFGLAVVPQGTPNALAVIPNQFPTANCNRGTSANNGDANNLGTAYHCNFVFGADGRMTPQTGTRVGSGPTGTFLGGNGQTSREGTQLSILPLNERYNFNVLAHYEFSPAVEAFLEAKYTRVNAVGNQLGPTFINGSTGSLQPDTLRRILPRLDNPYLNAADRASLAASILATPCTFTFGSSVAATSCFDNTWLSNDTAAVRAAKIQNISDRNAAVANGSYRFLFARNMTDLEDRDERFQRDTFRIVGGLRGTFNDDWKYELALNYGEFKEKVDMRGFVNRQRFLLSLDAAIDPANPAAGIQCRAKFDPAARVGAQGYSDSAATLAADVAACVPYNVFGSSDNSAAVAYFRQAITNKSKITQFDVSGFMSGDTSQFFNLPGGPVRFALGGEYRREKAWNDSDAAADNGVSNAVFLGDVLNAPAMEVKEAFGELQLPLLSDVPFARELTLSAAGRISDYNTAVGTVYTYNLGAEWAPMDGLRFRGNYGRAIRAPNVTEALFPNVPNFANNFLDPCSVNQIGNNPVRATNCQNELSAAQLANLPVAGYSLGIISGSNPFLKEEKSDSYTAGVVFTPSFVPGLTLSADYYHITVKNVIVSLAAQTIVNSCYDSPTPTPLCSAFQRNMTGSNGAKGELPGQILFNTLVSGPNNFASRVREGVDVEAAYRTTLGEFKLASRLVYSHTFTNSNFENPVNPAFENRLLSELGDPKDEFRFNLDVSHGAFTVGYVLRYIGPMLTTTYENLNPLNGLAPLNLDAFEITSYPAVTYHNLRFDWDIDGNGASKGYNFYVGVDNLTNKLPPLGTTATGAGSAIYSFRGRSFYAGFKANF